MSDDDTPTREKWLNAYNDMMMRVRTAIEEAEESTPPALKRFVHNARDLAVDLEELTRDEAEKIAMYLHRDIEDAGKHLAETGQELGDWLRFDIHQVEERHTRAPHYHTIQHGGYTRVHPWTERLCTNTADIE